MSDNRKAMDVALLVLRIGIGLSFLVHGVPKLRGGPETWGGLGGAMSVFGINFVPAFWGFMAAFAEAVGGAALILGVLLRPFACIMCFTMLVAALMHLRVGQGFQAASHAIEMGVVFVFLILAGGGRYGLGGRVKFLRAKWWQ